MQVAATPTKEQMAMKAAVDMPEFSYVCKFVLQHIPLEFFTSPPPPIFVWMSVYICSQISSFLWVSTSNKLCIAQVMLSLLVEFQRKPPNVTSIGPWSGVHHFPLSSPRGMLGAPLQTRLEQLLGLFVSLGQSIRFHLLK